MVALTSPDRLKIRLQRQFVGDDGSTIGAGGDFFDAGGEGAVLRLEFFEKCREITRVLEFHFIHYFSASMFDHPGVTGRRIETSAYGIVDAHCHNGPNGQTLRQGNAGGEMNRCPLGSRGGDWNLDCGSISQSGRLRLRLLSKWRDVERGGFRGTGNCS